MKALCLILTLIYSVQGYSAVRHVVCAGRVEARLPNKQKIDYGAARVRFQMSDKSEIRNIDVLSKFKELPGQTIEALEARAVKRAIASGKYKADLFNIGHNGACQIALGYQGDLALSPGTKSSWGVFVMGCGTHV